jgi:hypothetical protein
VSANSSAPGPQQKRFAACLDSLAQSVGHAGRIQPLKSYCTALLLVAVYLQDLFDIEHRYCVVFGNKNPPSHMTFRDQWGYVGQSVQIFSACSLCKSSPKAVESLIVRCEAF